jgi:uncharacterized protein (DUF1810 family)
MDDPFNLQRFVEAQAAVYPQVLDELMHGNRGPGPLRDGAAVRHFVCRRSAGLP